MGACHSRLAGADLVNERPSTGDSADTLVTPTSKTLAGSESDNVPPRPQTSRYNWVAKLKRSNKKPDDVAFVTKNDEVLQDNIQQLTCEKFTLREEKAKVDRENARFKASFKLQTKLDKNKYRYARRQLKAVKKIQLREREESSRLTTANNSLETENTRLRSANLALEDQTRVREAEHGDLEAELTSRNREIESLKQKYQNTLGDLASTRNSLNTKTTQVDELVEQIRLRDMDIKGNTIELETLRGALEDMEELGLAQAAGELERDGLNSQVNELSRAIQELKSKKGELLRREREEKDGEIQRLATENRQLQQRAERLQYGKNRLETAARLRQQPLREFALVTVNELDDLVRNAENQASRDHVERRWNKLRRGVNRLSRELRDRFVV
ncbi:hypothetical protein HDU76_001888 [Blyttiomyces sp. JEL0837]|nr:hypothetical protein HDU76_001888 [Blyttiomyces sp. JEL0837]